MKKKKKLIIIIFIILLLVLIDQTVKKIIVSNIYNSSIIVFRGFFSLTYVENTGGAYGIGNGNILRVTFINIVLIILLIKFILVKKEEINIQILIAISLVISGGISNLLDRIFRGYVIDYIDINEFIKYPVFNIADICIVLGCIIIMIYTIITLYKEK